MQILLADDERMVRLGLQSMLEELFPGKHTYLHARNGNEVVELLKKQSPDIAFLDVKMPLMDGLEALKLCRQLSTSTIWIILSGYADFEYARQALALSAFDYILKPIDLDTLKSLFDRILISQAISREQNNTVFAHDVIRSFNMADQFAADEVEFMPSAPSDYILYQFYMDIADPDIQSKIKQKLRNNLNSFCSNNASILSHCLFFNTEGNLCLICDAPDASRLTHFISLQAEGFPPNAFSVFFGNRKTIRIIYEISQRISRVADIRLVKNCSKPVFIQNIEALPSLSCLLTFSRAVTAALNLYLSQNRGLYRQRIMEMRSDPALRQTFSLIERHVLQNYLSNFFGQDIRFNGYDELLSILDKDARTPDTVPSVSNADIAQIKAFICQNYADDVSVSRVSELFGLSPSYLSKLFHEKTGQKYIDFVTQVRMEAAKKILSENPTASVKQVAQAVGYASVRHFSKIFQKYTGTFPSGYFGNG